MGPGGLVAPESSACAVEGCPLPPGEYTGKCEPHHQISRLERDVKRLEMENYRLRAMRPVDHGAQSWMYLGYDNGHWMTRSEIADLVDRQNERIKELEREKDAEARVWQALLDRAEDKAARLRLGWEM